MKTISMLLLCTLLSFVYCGCSESAASRNAVLPTSNTAQSNYFLQHWVHSSEEQTSDDEQIFRPNGSREFPPSRFRMQYVFREDGKCEWYFLSPDDNHRFKECTWRLDPSDESVLEITKDGEKENYRIVDLTKDILRLSAIN